MKILLDTHVLLWALSNKVNERISDILNDRNNTIYVSFASVWEIEIKHKKNPKLMPISGAQLLDSIIKSDYQFLNIKYQHFTKLSEAMKMDIHSDPFDLAIIAAAMSEKLTLMSHDRLVAKYPNLFLIHC